MAIDDGGPACPIDEEATCSACHGELYQTRDCKRCGGAGVTIRRVGGMSKREAFAMAAMSNMNIGDYGSYEYLAEDAKYIADAMLAALKGADDE